MMSQFTCFLSQYLLQLRQCFQTSVHPELDLTASQEAPTQAIQQGPVPQHLAFVMDGNRRFAKEHSLSTAIALMQGAEVLEKALEFCFASGVRVVTVYAFSIENFKRSKSQVQSTMDVITSYLKSVAVPGGQLERNGVVMRAIGRLDMLDPDVLSTIQHTNELTREYGDKILNVCIAYTSRDEISTAIRQTVIDCKRPTPRSQKFPALSYGALPSEIPNSISPSSLCDHAGQTPITSPQNITTETITSNMFTADNPPLDLLIRTSGVQRLSDFLLWQCHQETHIEFLETLWPDFNVLQLASAIQSWQRGKQKSIIEKQARKYPSQRFRALVGRTLGTTNLCHISESIQTHVNGLSRLPEHLSVILSLRKENDALHRLMDEAAEILTWAAIAGIPTISIYEKNGILKSHITKLHQVVDNKLSLYYTSSSQQPGVYVFAPHYGASCPLPVECASEKSNPAFINLMLLSSSDGRETLVDLTKSLAEMSQFGKLSPNDINIDLIDAKLSEITSQHLRNLHSLTEADLKSKHSDGSSVYLAEDSFPICSVKPDPDLMFVSGPYVKLDGYPPWQIRLTEIFRDESNANIKGRRMAMKYQEFLRGLSYFAGVEMRFGR